MPKATALWLLQNTELKMQQIADFCGMHVLEIQALSKKSALRPLSPIDTFQLTFEEIRRCEKDASQHLQLCTNVDQEIFSEKNQKKENSNLDPVKEKGIAWVIVNHPSIPDADVASLLKVGKKDVKRMRTIAESRAIKMDTENPVTLKICQKAALDRRIGKAAKNLSV
jgi:hypothetical protein